jgi:CDP-diacylglycerol--serine O-phosphatidyltransferase
MRRPTRLDLRKTLFILPNLITLSSVFCGFDSLRISASAQGEEDFYRAALLIVFAMLFDMLDGRVARMTKTQSAFGLQIDSLADVVSFGAAPALLVYEWTLHRVGTPGLVVSFLFVACGAVRLARFNVLSMGESGKPTKPSKYIVGLPIPGAAGILVSIVVANHAVEGAIGRAEYVWGMLGVTAFLSFPDGLHHPFSLLQGRQAQPSHRPLRGLRHRVERVHLHADEAGVRARLAARLLHPARHLRVVVAASRSPVPQG